MSDPPPDRTGRELLWEKQYADASNLHSRIRLHALYSTNRAGWYDWLFGHYRLPAGTRILELGCGSAQLWCHMGERIPETWEIMLTDRSDGMIQAAKDNLSDVPGSFSFHVADAEKIPFDNEAFDAVVANHMLYHVANRSQAFAEIRRVLKPGGQLYAATNGERHLLELNESLDRFGLWDSYSWDTYSFSLESGGPQLSEWFERVAVDVYDDALKITDVEPLMAYVRSMRGGSEARSGELDGLREWARQELREKGCIHITKASGVFTASATRAV